MSLKGKGDRSEADLSPFPGSLALGVMSGTSADGVSLALCSFPPVSLRGAVRRRGNLISKPDCFARPPRSVAGKLAMTVPLKILNYKTSPYPAPLSKQLRRGFDLKAPEISRLNILLGEFFANSILKFLKSSRKSPQKISVIGSHGHTIYHGGSDKPKNTLQIGEPCVIAEKTGIPVVADFRMRDLACGGQGAPLIPFFDQTFFGGGKRRALQNIGGIANVTVVGKSSPLLAFDNGPGNCLIDWAVQKISKGRKRFDFGGRIAARGRVDRKAVLRMAAHSYFKKSPPKSAGREIFNEDFIPSFLKSAAPENLVATLTYFTAYSIDQSYRSFVRQPVSEMLVSGGGVFNKTLMNHLSALFNPIPVRSIEEYEIPAQAKEPAAFAFFAWETLHGRINHSPQGTGATQAAILGKFVPGRNLDTTS